MRKFLVARQLKLSPRILDFDEVEKEQYSAVITEISTKEGLGQAVSVLETGFRKLRDAEKSFIAQVRSFISRT